MKRKTFFMITLSLTLAALIGCMVPIEDTNKATSKQNRALVVDLLYDLSVSARHTPTFSVATLDKILTMVRNSAGGEFGCVFIEDKKPRLIRVKFESETFGDALERRRRRELNDRELSRVRETVYQRLEAPRKAQQSPIFDSIEVAFTHLKEPHLPANSQKIAIIVSDFCEDYRSVTEQIPIEIPENVTCIVLGETNAAKISKVIYGSKEQVIIYTSTAGVIDFLSTIRSRENE